MADEVESAELTADERAGGCLAVGFLVALGLVAAVVLMVVFGGEDEPVTTYRVENFEFEVENPASIRVFADVTNTGGEIGSPSCEVEAADPSGAYRGFGTFDLPPVAPGEVGRLVGVLVIRNEGAGFVDDATIVCT